MCSFKAEAAVDPNQVLGESLGTETVDPSMTPLQAALAARDRMVDQANKMVRDALLRRRRREQAPAEPVAAAVPVLAEVSVQDDIDRMTVDMQAILHAVKDALPTTTCQQVRLGYRLTPSYSGSRSNLGGE